MNGRELKEHNIPSQQVPPVKSHYTKQNPLNNPGEESPIRTKEALSEQVLMNAQNRYSIVHSRSV